MIEPEIIFENKDFLILNKPAGLLVHGVRLGVGSRRLDDGELDVRSRGLDDKTSNIQHLTSDSVEGTLVDWLLENYPEVRKVGDVPEERPGIVHRLDRATSGIMIVPRNQEYFLYLKSLFSAGGGPSSGGQAKIVKTYLALVFGKFKTKEGVIDKPIGIKSGSIKRSVHSIKMSKIAVTKYKVIKDFSKDDSDFSLLEVRPETGRTHQIRVHLSSIGHPILGDELYGKSKKKLEVPRLMLHALSLEFSSREGEKLKFEATVPGDFKKITKSLGFLGEWIM